MVSFASLFLGLIVGLQPVELRVDPSVAAVEILVDGSRAGRVEGAPWSLVHDFGEKLVPHELVAVAYDAQGSVMGRASQWVNLPQSPATASLSLDRVGDRTFVLLDWESVVATVPDQVRVTFDGAELAVENLRRIELPEHDPDQLHFVRAELEFPRNISSVAEMTFGGTYAGGSRTELTAVPVELESGRHLPPVSELQGRFRKGERELEVVATEEGPANVLVVRDRSARRALAALTRSSETANERRRRLLSGSPRRDPRTIAYRMKLSGAARLRFVWPVAKPLEDADAGLEVFDFTPPLDARRLGVYRILTGLEQPPALVGEQRLADAVAVAGVIAARGHRRRAVVLILSADSPDASRLEASLVRGYLEALMVPLVVWAPDAGGRSRGRTRPDPSGEWGRVREIASIADLHRAVTDLNRRLDRQRLVWIEGLHLPQELSLESDSKLSLAR